MRRWVRLGPAGAQDWGQGTVAIVGGGPSLKGFDFARLKGRARVLAVNASIFDLPWADHGFTIDRRAARNWWPRLVTEVTMPLTFAVPDPWLVNFASPPRPGMSFIKRVQGEAFTAWPHLVSAGGTSGFGALHYAFLRGAKRIVLLGFDYAPSNGHWHHNEQHYHFAQRQIEADWARWAKAFDGAAGVLKAHGVEVLNASPRSAITAFEKISLQEVLT